MNKGIKTAICLLIAAAFMVSTIPGASVIGNESNDELGSPIGPPQKRIVPEDESDDEVEDEPGTPEGTGTLSYTVDTLGDGVNVPLGNLFEEDFESASDWLDWTVTEDPANGDTWVRSTDYGYVDPGGATGYAAVFDDDGYGSGSDNPCEELISPTIDCTIWTGVTLDFDGDFEDMAGDGQFWVDVSGDNGGTWTNVLYDTTDVDPGGSGTGYDVDPRLPIDISAIADNQPQVLIKFTYSDTDNGGPSGYAWGAMVDNVNLEGIKTIEKDVGVTAINSPVSYTPIEPKKVNITVKNFALAQTNIPVYYEICEEITNTIFFDEMDIDENWTAIDVNGDGDTWAISTARSYSPTHSYKCTAQNTYEPNAFDSLKMKNTVDLTGALGATLIFEHWCEGEPADSAGDYGMVYIGNTEVGGPYYDTAGGWEKVEIDLSAYVGQHVKVNFTWHSDFINQYEGWYIDDVTVNKTICEYRVSRFGTIPSLGANETATFEFDGTWTPLEEAYYQITAWTDLPGDENASNDELSLRMWFGNVCDAAVLGITAPSEVEKDPTGIASIPISYTVKNTGTLTKDVPVEVSAKHKLTNIIFEDDVESGELDGWGDPGMWVAGEALYVNQWTITDSDFFSPTHSWYLQPRPEGIGQAKLWGPLENPLDVEGGLKWDANIKYNIGLPDYDPDAGAMPVFLATTYYWDFGITLDRFNPWPFASGWTHFSADEFIQTHDLYWEERYFGDLDSFAELLECLNNRYGPPGQNVEDFSEITIGFLVQAPDGLDALQGFWFDDFKLYNEYAGATVWSNTTTFSLEPGESVTQDLTWAAENYCDYMITATNTLDCDMISTNDVMSTAMRIYNQIYEEDSYDEVEFEDNTYGLSDDWHIIKGPSSDHYWWNGNDETTTYNTNRNDVLVIDQTFNWTDATMAYINFSAYYNIEENWDYGYLEVSNDSGMSWFMVDSFTGYSDWADFSYLLEPSVTWLTSLSTGMVFRIPVNFFTANMHIRFRFYSDASVNLKGWFIDDVEVNAFDGTAWDVEFEDNMESGDGNWIHMMMPYGCHWHAEDTFGNGPTDSWFWNGESRYWIGTGTIYTADYLGDGFWDGTWTATVNSPSGASWNYWFGISGERLFYHAGATGVTDAWLNKTMDLSASSAPITVECSLSWSGTFQTYWFFATDGATTINYPIVFTVGPGHVAGGTETFIFDISAFAGSSSVTIGFHCNHTSTLGNEMFAQWQLYVHASGPTIPYHKYYNNVDEKAIFTFNLTTAYEAFLHFEHNYSFADENDIGWVEIYYDGEWKPIMMNKGVSDWSHVKLDITKYVNHEGLTKIRFRFVSDGSGTDYGWMIDNLAIDGKVDVGLPTTTCTLNPVIPDGDNGWYVSPVTITLTATDDKGIDATYYRIDGGAWLKYTAPITINIDGEHWIDYYSIDVTGNKEPTKSTGTFKIDLTAPTVGTAVPKEGYLYLFGNELRETISGRTIIFGGLTAEATASDATSGIYVVQFKCDGSIFGEDTISPYKSIMPSAFLFGSHTLTVTAQDFAGNTATSAAIDYLKIL